MTAIPDYSTNFDGTTHGRIYRQAMETKRPRHKKMIVARWVYKCLAVSLIASSIGIWALHTGDSAEMLVKLGASILMFGLGALFYSAGRKTKSRA